MASKKYAKPKTPMFVWEIHDLGPFKIPRVVKYAVDGIGPSTYRVRIRGGTKIVGRFGGHRVFDSYDKVRRHLSEVMSAHLKSVGEAKAELERALKRADMGVVVEDR